MHARVDARGASRFAPSVTGEAHPGTLLSALLAWLDARSRGDRFILRLEDLDHTRNRTGFSDQIQRDLAWLGLEWDELVVQSHASRGHEVALDRLAAAGVLYPCRCTRAGRVATARRAPDGGWAYDNRCRGRALPAGGWRASIEPIRLQLPDLPVDLTDESGLDLSQHPAREMGDPIVVRRDHVVAYQLAVVVDDDDAGVTRIVRGRDIAPSTATQVLIQGLLGAALPVYRHHFLLLETRGVKLAKLHGSIPARQLRGRYSPEEMIGLLAALAGLTATRTPIRARDLVGGFDWQRVRRDDLPLRWDGLELRF